MRVLAGRGAMSAQEVRNLIKPVMGFREHAVKSVPDMGHVIPDLDIGWRSRSPAFRCVSARIVEQNFLGAHMNERRRQVRKIGEDR